MEAKANQENLQEVEERIGEEEANKDPANKDLGKAEVKVQKAENVLCSSALANGVSRYS